VKEKDVTTRPLYDSGKTTSRGAGTIFVVSAGRDGAIGRCGIV